MSNDTELITKIANVNRFKHSDFNNLKPIGNGAFGRVFRANYRDHTDAFYALKIFNNDETTLKEVVNEV